jgi:hypothetical protein
MTRQTLCIAEGGLTGDGRRGRRRVPISTIGTGWTSEILRNLPTRDAAHVDARAEKRTLERRPSVDSAEAGNFSDGEEARDHTG